MEGASYGRQTQYYGRACGKFVFRKVVSRLRGGIPEYDRLLADFTTIVEAVNAHCPNSSIPIPRADTPKILFGQTEIPRTQDDLLHVSD